MSKRIEENKYLQIFAFLFFLLTLFYGSDFMAIWDVEADNAMTALANLSEGVLFEWGNGYSPLVQSLMAGGLSTVGLSEWGIRITSLIVLASSFFFYYKFGSKVFGERMALMTILLALGSFPLVLIGKIATPDIWLFGIQLIIFPLAIIQLKKSTVLRAFLLIFLNVLLVFIQPISALLFNVLFYGSLFALHKNGKGIIKEMLISIGLVLFFIFFFYLDWMNQGFLFSFDSNLSYYFLLIFTGSLAILGFIPTVLIHLFKRLKIKEELAVITFSALIAGLGTVSFLPLFILIFLVAKQIDTIDHPNYPYFNSIKAFTILQVVISFFIALICLLNGFQWFKGSGFRTALLFGTPLWGFGIYILVSIYSNNKNHILLGMILMGLISNFIFWTQVMPLWEAERNIYKDIAETSLGLEKDIEDKRIYFSADLSLIEPLHFYRRTILDRKIVGYTNPSERDDYSKTIYTIKRDSTALDSSFIELKSIKGRKYPWLEMKHYSVVKKK